MVYINGNIERERDRSTLSDFKDNKCIPLTVLRGFNFFLSFILRRSFLTIRFQSFLSPYPPFHSFTIRIQPHATLLTIPKTTEEP